MSQILTARKNQKLFVGDREEEILLGSILGDASILKKGMIQFEQGSAQKEYLEWKRIQLATIVSGKKIYKTRRERESVISYSYKFTTRQFFRSWRDKFYPQGKKVISPDLVKSITPLGLAVWYMDDGCLVNNYSCVIAADSFDTESIIALRNILDCKYGIKTRLRAKKKQGQAVVQYRLCVGGLNLVKFFNLIRPFIIPSMRYKITDPVTTQSIKRRNMRY